MFLLRSGVLGLFGMNTLTRDVTEAVLTCSELDAMSVFQETKAPALALPCGFSSLPQEVSVFFILSVAFTFSFSACVSTR